MQNLNMGDQHRWVQLKVVGKFLGSNGRLEGIAPSMPRREAPTARCTPRKITAPIF
jgi:hypothetical protein